MDVRLVSFFALQQNMHIIMTQFNMSTKPVLMTYLKYYMNIRVCYVLSTSIQMQVTPNLVYIFMYQFDFPIPYNAMHFTLYSIVDHGNNTSGNLTWYFSDLPERYDGLLLSSEIEFKCIHSSANATLFVKCKYMCYSWIFSLLKLNVCGGQEQ